MISSFNCNKRFFFLFVKSFSVSPGESLIFDNVNRSPDPLPSGAVGMATTITDVGAIGASNAGLLPLQVQFIKNLIDESLDEFRYKI